MVTTKQTKLNREELTVAHHNFNKGLNSYAFFKLNESALGQDLVQDTFTKTWAYLVKGGKVHIMKAFLYHILNNLIIDEYRKKKNKMDSLDSLLDKGFEPDDEKNQNLINILDGKAAIRRIDELPIKYKEIMHMRFVQNLTLHEISNITKKSKNSVAVQIYRGLEKLRLLCGPQTNV